MKKSHGQFDATHLVDRRLDFRRCQQNLHVLDAKVADTNAPVVSSQIVLQYYLVNYSLSKSFFLDFLHLRPTCRDVGYCQTWGMDQIKVNIRYPKLFHSKRHKSTGSKLRQNIHC
jgi:hypothetical protein